MRTKSIRQEYPLTIIQRWVKQKKQKSHNNKTLFTFDEFMTQADEIEEQKRTSKPSFNWIEDKQNKLFRIWFDNTNLTIKIDSYLSNGKYLSNVYEIDLERCSNNSSFLDYIRSITHKSWGCPDLLWAIMEIEEQVSSH